MPGSVIDHPGITDLALIGIPDERGVGRGVRLRGDRIIAYRPRGSPQCRRALI